METYDVVSNIYQAPDESSTATHDVAINACQLALRLGAIRPRGADAGDRAPSPAAGRASH